MPRLASLLLAAPLLAAPLLATPPAYASTVTDHLLFTYSNSYGTEQNNFTVADGSVATLDPVSGYFGLPVSIYFGTDDSGTPYRGEFLLNNTGKAGIYFMYGMTPVVLGENVSGFLAASQPVYQDGMQTGLLLFFQPGTYQYEHPQLMVNSEIGDLDSASMTVTQTTTDPIAVTPEPPTLVMLGTGLLSVGGMVRRRISNAAV